MPHTYFYFVVGYLGFLVLLYLLVGVLIRKVLRLESELEHQQQQIEARNESGHRT